MGLIKGRGPMTLQMTSTSILRRNSVNWVELRKMSETCLFQMVEGKLQGPLQINQQPIWV